jgi:hypothetical protein
VELGGQIYTSNDSGLTWTTRESSGNWESVASSADGTRLVAVVLGGQIYTSNDSGLSWTARESSRSWASVASSADGTRLVAVGVGQIYTSGPWTTPGTAGALSGGRFDAVELQYLGNGTFAPIRSQGSFTYQ